MNVENDENENKNKMNNDHEKCLIKRKTKQKFCPQIVGLIWRSKLRTKKSTEKCLNFKDEIKG